MNVIDFVLLRMLSYKYCHGGIDTGIYAGKNIDLDPIK